MQCTRWDKGAVWSHHDVWHVSWSTTTSEIGGCGMEVAAAWRTVSHEWDWYAREGDGQQDIQECVLGETSHLSHTDSSIACKALAVVVSKDGEGKETGREGWRRGGGKQHNCFITGEGVAKVTNYIIWLFFLSEAFDNYNLYNVIHCYSRLYCQS